MHAYMYGFYEHEWTPRPCERTGCVECQIHHTYMHSSTRAPQAAKASEVSEAARWMRWRAMEWAHWIATSSAEAEAPCEGDDDGQEEAAFSSLLFSLDTDEAIAFRMSIICDWRMNPSHSGSNPSSYSITIPSQHTYIQQIHSPMAASIQ
jgi:hypothetical protein